ncbi:hypothetical protein SRB5_70880 [Streptomyces sp. RB5]|uniref:Uncharacterized protein n=2 Tax=Streptomyces smaragdinus TaxID=2585196 RepID=A0A7K0CTS2_9ACTN|nr:hypothetical protein [Streptomyces smaragdinus]
MTPEDPTPDPTAPRRTPVRMCVGCSIITDEPTLITTVHQSTGPGFGVYACPDCAPAFPPDPQVLTLPPPDAS